MRTFFLNFLVLLVIASCKQEISMPREEIKIQPTVVKIEQPVTIDTVYLKKYHPNVFEFYKNLNFKTAWYQKKNREAYLSFLTNIYEDGLNTKDYYYDSIQSKISKFDSLSEAELGTLDAYLTNSFLKLANHIHSGKLNPTLLYNDWELQPKKINPEPVLQKTLQKQNMSFVLDSLRPKNKIYAKLRESLRDFKLIDADSSSIANLKIVTPQKLVVNDTNAAIIDIKRKLEYLDFYKPTDSINAVYTEDFVDVVKRFQSIHNLTPDGIIGLSTIKALNHNKNHRKNQIIANLERFRWYPDTLGQNYVIVNIPEFRLWLISDQDTLLSKKIIVGKPARRTPVLSSKFSDIVINPTWTVPPTILKKDLTPSAKRDLSYFSRNKIKIYKNGEIVAPEDWDSEQASKYRYVQDPGSHNSLGIIKFNFPNKHFVYLHDTNHKSGFGRDGRDLSSGCIRVNQPLDLATNIFALDNNKTMTLTKINELIDLGKTTSIRIKKPIYVHQFYWTVSLDQEEDIKYNDDVYNLDIALFNALQI